MLSDRSSIYSATLSSSSSSPSSRSSSLKGSRSAWPTSSSPSSSSLISSRTMNNNTTTTSNNNARLTSMSHHYHARYKPPSTSSSSTSSSYHNNQQSYLTQSSLLAHCIACSGTPTMTQSSSIGSYNHHRLAPPLSSSSSSLHSPPSSSSGSSSYLTRRSHYKPSSSSSSSPSSSSIHTLKSSNSHSYNHHHNPSSTISSSVYNSSLGPSLYDLGQHQHASNAMRFMSASTASLPPRGLLTSTRPISSSTTPSSSYISNNNSTISSINSKYSPSSTSLSTFYRLRLRERPLLSTLSQAIGSKSGATSGSRQFLSPNRNELSSTNYTTTTRTIATTPSLPTSTSTSAPTTTTITIEEADQEPGGNMTKKEDNEDQWSSDLTRNISRNKYIIKFRELDSTKQPLELRKASIIWSLDSPLLAPSSDKPSSNEGILLAPLSEVPPLDEESILSAKSQEPMRDQQVKEQQLQLPSTLEHKKQDVEQEPIKPTIPKKTPRKLKIKVNNQQKQVKQQQQPAPKEEVSDKIMAKKPIEETKKPTNENIKKPLETIRPTEAKKPLENKKPADVYLEPIETKKPVDLKKPVVDKILSDLNKKPIESKVPPTDDKQQVALKKKPTEVNLELVKIKKPVEVKEKPVEESKKPLEANKFENKNKQEPLEVKDQIEAKKSVETKKIIESKGVKENLKPTLPSSKSPEEPSKRAKEKKKLTPEPTSAKVKAASNEAKPAPSAVGPPVLTKPLERQLNREKSHDEKKATIDLVRVEQKRESKLLDVERRSKVIIANNKEEPKVEPPTIEKPRDGRLAGTNELKVTNDKNKETKDRKEAKEKKDKRDKKEVKEKKEKKEVITKVKKEKEDIKEVADNNRDDDTKKQVAHKKKLVKKSPSPKLSKDGAVGEAKPPNSTSKVKSRQIKKIPQQVEVTGSNEQLEAISPATSESESGNNNKRIRFREYNFDDFDFVSVLGHGGWGFVFLAELKNHAAYFAVKAIKKMTIIEDDDFESILIERKMLTLGNINPFICKLFCTFENEGYLFFVMEYCAGGDLMFHVQKEGKFAESRCRFYAAEIICAIRFLHNRHIIYRDLKLDNILLDATGHIRLVDFGMCQCRTYREELLPSNFCGTPEYISPEIIKGVPYNHSVDWWSFGVLLYEMAVGKMPFRGSDENELLWNVCYETIHYPLFLSSELKTMLQMLMERDPVKRLGMATCAAGDICEQPWFKGVDWKKMEELRVPPPFVPEVRSPKDVQNFDSDFTEATPQLSPVEESVIEKIDQQLFHGFSYTNPNLFFC